MAYTFSNISGDRFRLIGSIAHNGRVSLFSNNCSCYGNPACFWVSLGNCDRFCKVIGIVLSHTEERK